MLNSAGEMKQDERVNAQLELFYKVRDGSKPKTRAMERNNGDTNRKFFFFKEI